MSRDFRWTDLPGYALLLLPLYAMALAARRWQLVLPLVALCLLHPLIGHRLAWRRSPPERGGEPPLLPLRPIGGLLLAVPFAALTQLWEVRGRSGLLLNIPWYVSLYLLTIAVLKLYAPRDSRRFGVLLFAGASGIAACGADVRTWLYLGIVLPFAVATVIGLRCHMPQRRAAKTESAAAPRVAFGVVAALIFASTLGTSLLVSRNLQELKRAYRSLTRAADLLPMSPGGFSDQAQLGDVQDLKSRGRDIALRVFSERPPGYLRGRGFLTYRDGGWTSRREGVRLAGRHGAAKGRVRLPDRPAPANLEPELTVYTAARYGAHLFLPLEAAEIVTRDKAVALYPGGTAKTTRVSSSKGYGVCLSPEALRGESDRAEWLDVPKDVPELTAALDALSARLGLARGIAPDLAVAKIVSHFTSYKYKIGIQFDPGRDPLAQFLSEKSHGHCELFASSGALLLRRAGVPARYVTGFVCEEKSTLADGQWLARSEHAHAWVEYYDPQRGWTTAEFTPAGSMPPVRQSDGGEALMDWISGVFAQLKGAFQREGIKALLGLLVDGIKGGLLWLVETPWRLGAVALLVLAVWLIRALRMRRRRLEARRPRAPRSFSPALAASRQAYLELERRLTRQGHGRTQAETLREYAGRLDRAEPFEGQGDAVTKVRAFAACRYAPDT